jgi:GNAT superfamily N-acetyltransferase
MEPVMMTPPMRDDARPELRPATASDADGIAGLWHRAWPDGHLGQVPEALVAHRQLEDFRRRVPERLFETTVALLDGALAGFVTVHRDEVEQVYVASEARGGGTAKALLAHAERLVARRFARAWLAVVPGNARARRFYERNGWRDAGPFEYRARAGTGRVSVPCRRYEKHLEHVQ